MNHGSPGAVLLVEDEAELRNLFAMLLQLENIPVFEAADGEKGLEVFRQHPEEIELLITDLGLPNMGGVDLISALRSLKPSLRILGTSGLSSAEVQDMVISAGADDFIPKPFHPREALERVRKLLGRS